jgi:uncharacterized protein (DUF433 family)
MKELAPRITIDQKVCFGKPVIQGTRVHVTSILGHLAAGDGMDDIAKDYGITKEDVLACIGFALKCVERKRFKA